MAAHAPAEKSMRGRRTTAATRPQTAAAGPKASVARAATARMRSVAHSLQHVSVVVGVMVGGFCCVLTNVAKHRNNATFVNEKIGFVVCFVTLCKITLSVAIGQKKLENCGAQLHFFAYIANITTQNIRETTSALGIEWGSAERTKAARGTIIFAEKALFFEKNAYFCIP